MLSMISIVDYAAKRLNPLREFDHALRLQLLLPCGHRVGWDEAASLLRRTHGPRRERRNRREDLSWDRTGKRPSTASTAAFPSERLSWMMSSFTFPSRAWSRPREAAAGVYVEEIPRPPRVVPALWRAPQSDAGSAEGGGGAAESGKSYSPYTPRPRFPLRHASCAWLMHPRRYDTAGFSAYRANLRCGRRIGLTRAGHQPGRACLRRESFAAGLSFSSLSKTRTGTASAAPRGWMYGCMGAVATIASSK